MFYIKISCAKSVTQFATILGPELMTSLAPHLKELIDDKKCRVRDAGYEALFDLAVAYQVKILYTR